jgi:hypothetical protein
MIRKTTTLLTVGFLTLSGLTAMAVPARHTRHVKANLAAATEGAAPAGDTKADAKTDTKTDKKAAKSTKGHATKEKAAEGTPTPAPPPAAGEKMPEKK